MQSWANYIARFRRVRGLTQKQAAALLQVSQATLSRWEAGKQVPTVSERRRIQQAVEAITGEGRRTLITLVRVSPVAVALLDERLEVLAVSDPLLRLFDLHPSPSPEQVIGQPLFGPDRPLLEKAFGRAREALEPIAIDRLSQHVTAQGSQLYLRQLWIPFVCGLGDILCRVEVGALDPADYRARLAKGCRITVLSHSELVGVEDSAAASLPLSG